MISWHTLTVSNFKRDCIIAGLFFFAAFVIRVPYISYPNETVFDEYYYATLVSNDVHGWRYFSYHPPLSTMFLGLPMNSDDTSFMGNDMRQSFGNFPYERGRFMVVLVGSLIPGLVYALFRQLKIPWKFALLGAGITVFDSLLITYSRLMLPDSLLWVCGILSVIFSLLAVRDAGYRSILYGCISAIFIGLAVSVKWTGLVFGAVAIFGALVFTKRPLRNVLFWSAVGSLLVVVVYVGVIDVHLRHFEPGFIDSARGTLRTSVVHSEQLYYPGANNVVAVFQYIKDQVTLSVQLQKVMADSGDIFIVGKPECWPFSCGSFGGWYSDRASVIFGGNLPAFIVSALSIFFLAVFYSISLLKHGSINVEKEELFIFLSFACIYIPTLVVGYIRPMFVYHYVPAYFFALAAFSICLHRLYRLDMRIGKIGIWASVIVIFIFFLIQSPYTYGF